LLLIISKLFFAVKNHAHLQYICKLYLEIQFGFKTKEQMEMKMMLQQMACKHSLSNGDFQFPVLILLP